MKTKVILIFQIVAFVFVLNTNAQDKSVTNYNCTVNCPLGSATTKFFRGENYGCTCFYGISEFNYVVVPNDSLPVLSRSFTSEQSASVNKLISLVKTFRSDVAKDLLKALDKYESLSLNDFSTYQDWMINYKKLFSALSQSEKDEIKKMIEE